MKSKYDIIAEMAEHQMVETMVQNIAHQTLSADLKDLSQMVYVILLEYDDDKIIDLWEKKQMQFFISKIIINQYRSTNSPFHSQFRKFRMMIDEGALLDNKTDLEEGTERHRKIHYGKGE